MEVTRQCLGIRQEQQGVKGVFLISPEGDMSCGDILFHEYDDHYIIIITKEEKIDQLDLAIVLYHFCCSNFFNEEKGNIILDNNVSVQLKKNQSYSEIFDGLNTIFKKVI